MGVAAAVILVVDDEAPVRDVLALVLEDLGHRVVGIAKIWPYGRA